MKKLYVGCPLTQVPVMHKKVFSDAVISIKYLLSSHFEILEFLGKGVGTAAEVYAKDIREGVKKADCMLAIYPYPANGLVYEIATALEAQQIPVIIMVPHGFKISPLIEGNDSPNLYIIRYSLINEIPNKFLEVALALGLME